MAGEASRLPRVRIALSHDDDTAGRAREEGQAAPARSLSCVDLLATGRRQSALAARGAAERDDGELRGASRRRPRPGRLLRERPSVPRIRIGLYEARVK